MPLHPVQVTGSICTVQVLVFRQISELLILGLLICTYLCGVTGLRGPVAGAGRLTGMVPGQLTRVVRCSNQKAYPDFSEYKVACRTLLISSISIARKRNAMSTTDYSSYTAHQCS